MNDSLVILIFVGVSLLIIAVVILVLLFNRRAIVRRKLRKTPSKDMRDVLTGDVVRITGKIELAGRVLTAPLSGRKCSYYHVEIMQHQSSGKNSRWVTILNDEQAADVIISDGRSHALIVTAGSKCHLMQDNHHRSGFLKDATPELNAYLASKGISSTSWFGLNKSMKYKEGVLEAGETVTVCGRANWIPKSQLNFDIPADRILQIEAPLNDVVYFTDEFVPESATQASGHVQSYTRK